MVSINKYTEKNFTKSEAPKVLSDTAPPPHLALVERSGWGGIKEKWSDNGVMKGSGWGTLDREKKKEVQSNGLIKFYL